MLVGVLMEIAQRFATLSRPFVFDLGSSPAFTF
jgi:hypothetical protein